MPETINLADVDFVESRHGDASAVFVNGELQLVGHTNDTLRNLLGLLGIRERMADDLIVPGGRGWDAYTKLDELPGLSEA